LGGALPEGATRRAIPGGRYRAGYTGRGTTGPGTLRGWGEADEDEADEGWARVDGTGWDGNSELTEGRWEKTE
jgi:hypothetical protein